MGEARRTVFIEAPMEDVHNYGKDPRRWQEWFVNFHGPDKMTGEGGEGTIIEAKFSIMGKKFPATIEILEDRVDFWKARTTGPLEGEMTAFYSKKDNGTEVTIEWTYTLLMGKIGKIADALAIEKIIGHGLNNSMENWKTICESAHNLVSH